MNFEDLKTFISIAQTKNFSKTAETLYVSQSTITLRIKTIENELGKKLFIRNNKYVELTTAGKNFLSYANRICKLMQEGEQSVRNSGRFESFISIAAPDSLWEYVLYPIVIKFMEKKPHIALKLFCKHSQDIVQNLMDNLVHVGIAFAKPYYYEIESIPFFKDEYCLVGTPTLQLADTKFSMDTLKLFPFIYINWGPLFKAWFEKSYPSQIYFLQVERVFLFVNLLLSGKGIGFLPKRIAGPYLQTEQLKLIECSFNEDLPTDQAYILYLKRSKYLVEDFISELLSHEKIRISS